MLFRDTAAPPAPPPPHHRYLAHDPERGTGGTARGVNGEDVKKSQLFSTILLFFPDVKKKSFQPFFHTLTMSGGYSNISFPLSLCPPIFCLSFYWLRRSLLLGPFAARLMSLEPSVRSRERKRLAYRGWIC